jgi:hypothetical protein
MFDRPEPRPAPRLTTAQGAPRRIGIEIEFAAVSAEHAGRIVERLYGGRIEPLGPHRFRIASTRLGDFVAELDTRLAHGPEESEESPEGPPADWPRRLERDARELIGILSSPVVPCEVVAPPVALEHLTDLEALVEALREAGAEGTEESLVFGFGLHLNPEAAELTAPYVLSVLRAHILLNDWLRHDIGIDLTRRLLPYARPFPERYARRVLAAGYRPELRGLIDDYLADNATRNRDLDLLPLFAHLDAARVETALRDGLTKPRPTFHYRLPGARLGDPHWTLTEEWNRWVLIEILAEDSEGQATLAEQYLAHDHGLLAGDGWRRHVGRWVAAQG